MNRNALLPGKQRGQNEADSLPAPSRCVTQHVLGSGVPQIMNFTVFVAPSSHVDAIILPLIKGIATLSSKRVSPHVLRHYPEFGIGAIHVLFICSRVRSNGALG